MKPHLVHLAGPDGEGRERFLRGLVAALQRRGVVVGLLRAAGEGPSLTLPGQPMADPAEALARLRNLDLVLSLLPAGEGQPLVEFAPGGAETAASGRPGRLAAAGPGDEEAVAEMLAQRAARGGDQRSITVLADGKPLPAKPFVQDILANTLHGLIKPLRGTEGATRLEIIIE